MTLLGGFGSALLLIAQPLAASGDAAVAATAQVQFAPPVGRAMTYRVTTRRVGRNGALINFSLVYALQWQRIGRGYQLNAVLQPIDSDAPQAVTRALTVMLQPLVGEEVAYLVAPDGNRIDLVDPTGLWERVTARMQATGAEAGRPEAKQLAELIAALPAAERDRLATADIRAMVAPANAAIPVAPIGEGAGVSTTQNGRLRTIAKVERGTIAPAGAAQVLDTDHVWTIDTATGLVIRERRQSWIAGENGSERTLVEERERALEFVS